MIIGVIGNRGSGKTLFMVREAFEHYKKGKTIYSNFKLKFPKLPNTKQPKLIPDDFFINFEKYNLKDVVMLLDEIYIYIDSRCSGSKINKLMSYFFNQTRKTGVELYYSTQFLSQVDKRLRLNTETFCLPKCITKGDNKKIRVDICNRDLKVLKKWLLKANTFFNLYDTYQIISFKESDVE